MAAVQSFETELPFGGLRLSVTGSESELKDLSEFLIGDTRRTQSLYTGMVTGPTGLARLCSDCPTNSGV